MANDDHETRDILWRRCTTRRREKLNKRRKIEVKRRKIRAKKKRKREVNIRTKVFV